MPDKLTLESLSGHGHAKAVLKAALVGDRIAHAYLFHGEPGIGKFTTAMIFASTAICEEREQCGVASCEACGRCAACRTVAAGNHPDIAVLRPEGATIKIDRIRELQSAITFKPFSAPRKWCIVDDAETMTLEAANCFLKTLEEPPPHSTLILVTARPQALPATIRSRCQAVRFTIPPREETIRRLQSERGLSAGQAAQLTGLTLGRPGAAMEADLSSLLAERERLFEILSPERLREPETIFEAPEALAPNAEALRHTLNAIEIYLRDLLIGQHCSDDSLLLHQDIKEMIHRRGSEISPRKLLEAVTLIQTFKRGSTRNLNPALVIETVLLFLRDAMAEAGTLETRSAP